MSNIPRGPPGCGGPTAPTHLVVCGTDCQMLARVGHELANRIQVPFVQGDYLFELHHGVSREHLERERGADAVDRAEAQLLHQLLDQRERLVVASRATLAGEAHDRLVDSFVVWLGPAPIVGSPRESGEVAPERSSLWEVADLRIDEAVDANDIIEHFVSAWRTSPAE